MRYPDTLRRHKTTPPSSASRSRSRAGFCCAATNRQSRVHRAGLREPRDRDGIVGNRVQVFRGPEAQPAIKHTIAPCGSAAALRVCMLRLRYQCEVTAKLPANPFVIVDQITVAVRDRSVTINLDCLGIMRQVSLDDIKAGDIDRPAPTLSTPACSTTSRFCTAARLNLAAQTQTRRVVTVLSIDVN